jgi:hypothetical protein
MSTEVEIADNLYWYLVKEFLGWATIAFGKKFAGCLERNL